MAWVTSFLDGFDHYATADIPAKWDDNTGGATIDSVTYRNTGQSMKVFAASRATAKKFAVGASNLIFGCGIRLAGANNHSSFGGAYDWMLTLTNALDVGSGEGQLAFTVFSDGKVHVARISGTTTINLSGATQIGVGTTVLSTNTWYYLEVRVFIHATAGAVEVRINGAVDLLLTGVNTKGATSSSVVAEFLNLHGIEVSNYNVDDLYMRYNTSATEVTGGFLGDIKVKPYLPNGDGTYSAMTCSTGSAHAVLVDESTPNTTDYVSSSTALQKDSYNFADVSETGSIKAVQLSAYAYKMDAGFRGLDLFTKSGATENFATSQPLSTTQRYLTKVWEQDPNTSADWSQSNLNAAEFGVRISADL